MPEFHFKSIVLHALPDIGGWEVYGITHHTDAQEQLATLSYKLGKEVARLVAKVAALQLAGKGEYDED
jgi:hypothetical protein